MLFGKSRSHVTNLLGLLNLPEKAKELVKEQKISMGHAKVLSKISDEELQEKTNEFRKRLESGETLEDIKFEAYAVCREAYTSCRRVSEPWTVPHAGDGLLCM